MSQVLPDRVRAIIAHEDRASERLIGRVQLGIGLLLVALYTFAPKPIDAVGLMSPVPRVLTIYLAFSLLRLWLIERQRTPDWFVGLSIAADIGLLLAVIWLFHGEYGQPPGFSLKAPAFVYLFVFVVLRALRFDPRYVITAGAAAAAGWIILTAAVISASQPTDITRSFSDYATSARILIGAEAEKVFALLLVTALLALASQRAQRTLVAAVREEAAAREIGRFLSRGVADQIARSETQIEAGHATEREAAVLMLDIRGFTKFAMGADPKDVVAMLTSLHTIVVPIVRGNRGVIDKFLGDEIMATFGAVEANETAAADALRALDAILIATQKWEDEQAAVNGKAFLRVNAAVASGRVVFATLGDGNRLEYTVIGDAANLAAKLEKHNKQTATRALYPADMLADAKRQGYAKSGPTHKLPASNVAGVTGCIDLVARA